MTGVEQRDCIKQASTVLSRSAAALVLVACLAMQARSQQPMGTVATRDALVTGGLEVQGDQARLLTNTSITAYGHTAPVALARGGEVLVCSTTQFHLLHSGPGAALLFGLDRGAIELRTAVQVQDVVITPDLRLTPVTAGKLDLRLRVTANGDTCLDNAGAGAPVLSVSDAFSTAGYRLLPGQHVLFEHGNLRQVVDHERSACGCPAAATPNQTTKDAAGRNPFPEDVSAGLAPEQAAVAEAPGTTEVSSTIAFSDNGQGGPAAKSASPPTDSASPAAPPSTPSKSRGLGARIGRFFHHLFHPGS